MIGELYGIHIFAGSLHPPKSVNLDVTKENFVGGRGFPLSQWSFMLSEDISDFSDTVSHCYGSCV